LSLYLETSLKCRLLHNLHALHSDPLSMGSCAAAHEKHGSAGATTKLPSRSVPAKTGVTFFKTHLTYSYIGMYFPVMARASTTSDAFNAVAEPRRREILSYLAGAERPVGEIVAALGLEQPSVSKHLRVLRNVGLVRMRCQGRQKLYRTNAEAIRPLHEWAATFERYWQHQLNRVKELAEATVRKGSPNLNSTGSKLGPNLDSKPKEK
jgi:DNA-binding transcriptional ArsR family regulator